MRSPDLPESVRALIADDEPAARRGLDLLLSRQEDVEVVGECASAPEIGPAIVDLTPDVVFLDVRMPGGTGIDAFRRVNGDALPLVVLVTAHEEHALEAFDIEAVDYLLKPFTDEAFQRSLRRVRRHLHRIRAREVTERLAGLMDRVPQRENGRSSDRIAVRSGQRIQLVDPGGIHWIEADGDYVRVHTSDGEHLLRETMQAMEARFSEASFIRIHRSSLVRADFIREVRSRGGGRYEAVLEDGSCRNISRNGQERLGRALGVDL